MTDICISNLIIIGRRQAIIRTNVEILLIRTLGIYFSEILIEMIIFHSRKCISNVVCKMAYILSRPWYVNRQRSANKMRWKYRAKFGKFNRYGQQGNLWDLYSGTKIHIFNFSIQMHLVSRKSLTTWNQILTWTDISYNLLRHTRGSVAYPLSITINQQWSTGRFPNWMRLTKFITLYNKYNSKLFGNYRPIYPL